MLWTATTTITLFFIDARSNGACYIPTTAIHDWSSFRCPTGTVKWFNTTKGYGFIMPQGGGKDVFVHISAVERAGLRTLNAGQAIELELASDRGKTSAENLRVR
jgi:CspA family cold shock protein